MPHQYNSSMTIEQVQKLHRAQPFRTFRLHMADGRSVDVPHPDFLAHPGGGRTIVVFTRDDQFEIIDLLLVASAEVLNGHIKPLKPKR
jgi:hypothetical protein